MMFRPRESFDQHVLESTLLITPEPVELRYMHDVFGNSIGIARFDKMAEQLTFESVNRLEHRPEKILELPYSPDGGMNSYPFAYSSSDYPDLQSCLLRADDDKEGILSRWSRRFLTGVDRVDALHVLEKMNYAIHAEFDYVTRLEGPPQRPSLTVELRQGTCRDFALLMVEAARSLGLAARYVSGYLCDARQANRQISFVGGGHTHAWVRVFLPNGGWAEYDPTNGIVGNQNLIRVAVAREPGQAMPLRGTWNGPSNAYLGMEVDVGVF